MGKLCSVSSKVEEVLITLYKEPLSRAQLREKLGFGAQTITNITRWLLKNGLVEEKIEGRYLKLVLTDRGRKLAELVMEIEKLIA